MKSRNTDISHTDATREGQDGPSSRWLLPWSKVETLVAGGLVAAFGLMLAFTVGALMARG